MGPRYAALTAGHGRGYPFPGLGRSRDYVDFGLTTTRTTWLAFRVDEFWRPAGWDGAVNAWHVAGAVFRMGRREWLTEAGWQQAYDGGIRTVVDLRNPEERRRRDTDPP